MDYGSEAFGNFYTWHGGASYETQTLPNQGVLVNGWPIGLPRNATNFDPFNNPTIFETPPSKIGFADVQIWFGQFINPNTAGNLAKFIGADGKPVNPTVASTAFGTPTILFKGNAEDFPVNGGTGGAFTKTGTVSDYTPGP
jgi:hypothetical protein